MGNKITQMISQKMQDLTSLFTGDKRSAIQKITDIAVTDELLASYTRRYASRIRNDRMYYQTVGLYGDDNIYERRDSRETDICECTYARYCEAADRRLPVYMFLNELERSRDVQLIAFYRDNASPVIEKANFCFAKGGVRYTCDLESSFSVVEGGENTCEITVKSGENEVKRKIPLQSFLDDPITMLEFAKFLYGQEDGHKKDHLKQEIGSFSFNGVYRMLGELLKSAMQEREINGYRIMSGETDKVIKIYNGVKREKESRKQRTQEFRESINAERYVELIRTNQEVGRANIDRTLEL